MRWGRVAKDTAVEKQIKYRTVNAHGLLRSFRKGWGASAKQRWGRSARWGGFAKDIYVRSKVRSDRKGGVKTQKDEPKLVLLR